MRRGLFYGWIVAIALALLASVNNSGSFAFGLFLVPLGQQFGVDRATLVLAPTINRWVAGLLQPFGGYLADRFGSRVLGTVGASLFALSMLSIVFVHSVPMIYVCYGLLGGLGLAMTGGGMSARIIGAWFTRRRGAAMSLASGGIIIGQLILIPIVTFIMLRLGWRIAAVALSLIVLFIIVPTAWILIRNTPGDKGLLADGVPTPSAEDWAIRSRQSAFEPGISLREAIHRPVFWLLAFGLIACGVTMSFPNNHLAAFTMDMGMSEMTASEMIGIAGLLSLPGALLLGYVGDRVGRQRTLAVAYGFRALTYFILLQAHDPQVLLTAGVVLGISWGATVPLTSAIVADVFGTRALATIVSTMTALMYIASGTFTYVAGVDFVQSGNYNMALAFGMAIGVLACGAALLVRTPQTEPAPVSEPAVA